jgi:hypothetical protein
MKRFNLLALIFARSISHEFKLFLGTLGEQNVKNLLSKVKTSVKK